MSLFSGPITHPLSMLCILMKILSHASGGGGGGGGAYGFQILHFHGSFSSDIMALK